MNEVRRVIQSFLLFSLAVLFGTGARADAVTDWNVKACDFTVEARMGPPAANRVLAIVHTSVFEAVNAITRRYPAGSVRVDAQPGASVDAAVAAANRAVLLKFLPGQKDAVEKAYQSAIAGLPDGAAKTAGIAAGESAAAAVMAMRADDGMVTQDSYRPITTPGVYVPTVTPAAAHWNERKPWLMSSASQFRPGPPPALTSDVWARDFNEIKALGGKNSKARSEQQTAIATFWEATMPPIYHGLLKSVATQPGREVTQNARLFMATTQAVDDAMIAVFEAKYHYNFWRPVTAIRNADKIGVSGLEREATWTPYIDTPMHPEYPCAHCIVSGTVGTVLKADLGSSPVPTLTTNSSTAKNAARSWTSVDDFMREVAEARIYDGVHYRNSTEVGTEMGRKIGGLAAAKYYGK
jgi:hypothetical protein